ncbi:hypothetical protein BJY24_005213 [Nocardia transvalensis]|uniref:Tetratricopeptide repeat protein n=1 Tax=Nocardia transvalensis TaxID=37333 RepID=A0A7W9PHJ7_9NOCA|nr:hypothetical protein [Nocardia transvalensis]MBB5916301.1 hypothetical protein [Nocardia transvalensis]
MTETPREPHRAPAPESAATLIATPKSSVWQGLLGSAWVIASSIMLEVVAKLLEGVVGENPVVSRIVGALRWIVVLAVVVAAVYLVWRRLSDMRERVRRGRELDMTATLVEPAVPVRERFEPTAFRPPSVRPDLLPEDVAVAAGLRDLALPDYESAALFDVVSAMLAAEHLLPAHSRTPEPRSLTAAAVIRRLMAHEVLAHCAEDRFADRRRRAEPEAAERTRRTADVFRLAYVPAVAGRPRPGDAEVAIRNRAARQAMAPALLRHYADRAQRWVIALDSNRLGAGARRWFTDEWLRLAELVEACAPPPAPRAPTLAPGPDYGRADARRAPRLPEDLRRTVDVSALARIADALDVWYAYNGWPEDADGVAAAVRRIMDSPLGGDRPELRALARIRAGEPGPRVRAYRPRRYSTSLQARRAHRLALQRLDTPDAPAPPDPPPGVFAGRVAGWTRRLRGPDRSADPPGDALDEVVDQLEKAWWWLPYADIAGEVCALVDLAIVHLRQGRLVAARNRLELAESLTRSGRDPAGRAHTFEIMGVLWWMRGEPRRALRFWQLALTRYDELNHRLGTARCLQHLGSAAAVAPEYGSLLLTGDLDTDEVLRQASGWLARAQSLHPAALLAADYREPVCARLVARGVTPLSDVDQWPLPVADGGDPVVALA